MVLSHLHKYKQFSTIQIDRRTLNEKKKKKKEQGKYIRRHILGRLGPNKRLNQLDRHPLLGLGSSQLPVPRTGASHTRRAPVLDVAADRDDVDIVHVGQVVAEIELAKVQGDVEGGESGVEEWGAQ